MEVEVLPPTVRDGEETGFHAQPFGVGDHGQDGLCRGAKEDVIDDLFDIEGT